MATAYQPKLHVVLYEPEIPQNTGNIGRTCVATACKLWLVQPMGFQIDEKQCRRAGLDYWDDLELEIVPNWAALRAALPERRYWFFTKTGENSYADFAYQPDDVLVFGSESRGLPQTLLSNHRDRTVRIPIRPQVRSLNLSNSVAVGVYEALRTMA